MIKRRRKTRLGSSPLEHGKIFTVSARDMVNRARQAAKAAQAGHCESAMNLIIDAKYDQGQASAHHRGIGKSRRLGLRQYHDYVQELSAARRTFDRYCQLSRRR